MPSPLLGVRPLGLQQLRDGAARGCSLPSQTWGQRCRGSWPGLTRCPWQLPTAEALVFAPPSSSSTVAALQPDPDEGPGCPACPQPCPITMALPGNLRAAFDSGYLHQVSPWAQPTGCHPSLASTLPHHHGPAQQSWCCASSGLILTPTCGLTSQSPALPLQPCTQIWALGCSRPALPPRWGQWDRSCPTGLGSPLGPSSLCHREQPALVASCQVR